LESSPLTKYDANYKKEELPPSLLEFTKTVSGVTDKTLVVDQTGDSPINKNRIIKGSLYALNDKLNEKLNDYRDNIENRNLNVNKIENKDVFKKISNNDNSYTELKPFNSPDVLTDLKKSLEKYNSIISKLEKKNKINNVNKTEPLSLSSNINNKNNVKDLNVKPSPLVKSKSDISLIKLNEEVKSDNPTSKVIPSSSIINDINKINEKGITVKSSSTLEKRKSDISLIKLNEEIKSNYSKTKVLPPSSIVSVIDNINEKDTNIKPSLLVKSKSEISLMKLNNEVKSSNFTSKALPLVKSKSEVSLIDLDELDERLKKKNSFEKKLISTNVKSTLNSPLSLTHSSTINEKKSKSIDVISTPTKKESNFNFRTPEKETYKNIVGKRIKAIWDSTTKGLQSTFSRSSSASSTKEKKSTNIDLFGSSIFSSSHNLYSSPERDSSISALAFSKGSKSTDFKRERLRNQYLKFGSASIPSKNKVKYLFGTDYENLHIDFKDYKNNASIFNSNFDDLKEYNSSSIYAPPDSPLASKSKIYTSNFDELNDNKDDKLIHFKKSMSDITSIINSHSKENNKNIPQKQYSWNTAYDFNSHKDLPSFIPKHSKLKQSEVIQNKSKIATLASAKLIKKREERLNLEKKKQIKLNVERHRLYLQRKEEEEEREKILKKKEEKKNEKEEKEKDENRIKSEKILEQMKHDMEALIRKRNEKIKQVQEKKQALKQKELTKKSILMNPSRLYGSNVSSSISNIPVTTSILDKYKSKIKPKVKTSSSLDTHTSITTIKNTNGKRPSLQKLSKPETTKKVSLNSSFVSTAAKKSSIIKSNTTAKRNSKYKSSVSNIKKTSSTSAKTNTSSYSSKVSYKPILSSLTQSKDESYQNNDPNSSIISISSSRSSTTSIKETIIKDGEIPDIPSE